MAMTEGAFGTASGAATTKLLQIKEKPNPGASTSVSLLRGIQITELFGSSINPEPRHIMEGLVDKGKRTASEDDCVVKSDWIVDKDVVIREHITDNLLRSITGCQDFSLIQSLELKVSVSRDSSVGNFGVLMPNLKTLKLSDSTVNCIREIGTGFDNLRVLWMSRCGLEDLDGVSSMFNLKEVYLSYNLVNDLSPCGMLESLEILDLEGNSLDDVGQVDYLSLCSSLTHLTLDGNPVCLMPRPDAVDDNYDYRQYVVSAIPCLQVLDDIKVDRSPKHPSKPTSSPTSAAAKTSKPKRMSSGSDAASNLKTDFADDWAFISSFLEGSRGGAGGDEASSVAGLRSECPKTAGETSPRKLTVRDICGGDSAKIREVVAPKPVMEETSLDESRLNVFSDNAALETVTAASTKSPRVRPSSAVQLSDPTASSTDTTNPSSPSRPFRINVTNRPWTAGRRRPMSALAAGGRNTPSSRPSTTPQPIDASGPGSVTPAATPDTSDSSFSRLTIGNGEGTSLCGNISRVLRSRSKQSLSSIIDTNPASASSSSCSQRRVTRINEEDDSQVEHKPQSQDELDLNPLQFSSPREPSPPPYPDGATSTAPNRDPFDDDFAIHVVDSAQQQQEKPQHRRKSASGEGVPKLSPRQTLVSSVSEEGIPSDIFVRRPATSTSSGAMPKLMRSPAPPTVSKSPRPGSGVNAAAGARRTRFMRASAESPLMASSTPSLPPINLKKSY